uniref:ANF_receptor domain-containing protein n=1 Tax=Steinernema glaseri TaxID=37863 RepID=A0A1I7YXR7_9BILA
MNTLSPWFIEGVCGLLSSRSELESSYLAYPWNVCARPCENVFDLDLTVFGSKLCYKFRNRKGVGSSPSADSNFIISTVFIGSDRKGPAVDSASIASLRNLILKSRKPPMLRFSSPNCNPTLWQLLSGVKVVSILGDTQADRQSALMRSVAPYGSLSAMLLYKVELTDSFLKTTLELLEMTQFKHLSLTVSRQEEEKFDNLLEQIVRSLGRRSSNDRFVMRVDKRKTELIQRVVASMDRTEHVEFNFATRFNAVNFQVCFHGGRLVNALCKSCSC